jgi:hypothetical protein
MMIRKKYDKLSILNFKNYDKLSILKFLIFILGFPYIYDYSFCRLRPGGGEGASRNGPAANYEARAERRAEEKATAARAAAVVGDDVAAARASAFTGCPSPPSITLIIFIFIVKSTWA